MAVQRTIVIAIVAGLWLLVGVTVGGCASKSAPARSDDASAAGETPSSKPAEPVVVADATAKFVPEWAQDATFYQVFPERFANGDRKNDPTRPSLEFPDVVPEAWQVSPWTGDWYARAPWEQKMGPSFFENGVFHRRYGGDLRGIINKLGYLKELGVNTLYLNPVFYAKSLHKYDGNTYHHIDPYFGSDPAGDFALLAQETSDPKTWKWTAADRLFLELVKQLHAHEMRIVIDGVFNHTGRDFFAFDDLRKNQAKSPYHNWYVVTKFDDPATEKSEFAYNGWWGVDTLPEFANNAAGDDLHPEPKQYIFDATRRWMDPNGDGDPADGIDGWRLDVANEVPNKFWRDWHGVVRKLNPQAYTVAEVWEDAAKYLEDCQFSATMNYHGFAFIAKGFLIDGVMTASDAGRELQIRSEAHSPERRYALQNLIDSHDTDRVASMIVNADSKRPYLRPDRYDYDIGERASPRNWREYKVRKPTLAQQRLQRLVALLQFTFVGPPMVYYGDEAGMWGGDDPCDRAPMVWPDLKYAPQTADPLGRDRTADLVAYDHELAAFYSAGLKMREGLDALRRGTFKVLVADDAAKCLTFMRSDHRDDLYVILNRGDKDYTFTLPLTCDAPVAEVFKASGKDAKLTVKQTGVTAVVTLEGRDGAVLRQYRPDW